MIKEMIMFSEWEAAKNDTWFITRSPYPDVPCFITPVAQPTAMNYSSYLSIKASVQEVKNYLIDQVRILRFNNPTHKPLMVKAAIITRIVYWQGNAVLFRDAYFLTGLLDLVIDESFSEDCADYIMYWDKTKYWYSDEIVKMSGMGRTASDRFKAKQAARQSIISEGYIDDIKVASGEYKRDNFDVLPPLKILTNSVRYSNNTVKKYGEGFYINQIDNIGLRVQRAKEIYPDRTQKEIAYMLEVSIRTIKGYWNINKGEGSVK